MAQGAGLAHRHVTRWADRWWSRKHQHEQPSSTDTTHTHLSGRGTPGWGGCLGSQDRAVGSDGAAAVAGKKLVAERRA